MVGKQVIAAAAIMTVALATALVTPASAQDRFEAGVPGLGTFGGYNSFGGYYDTFGGYGGQYAYGYRRYNGNYSSTTSLFSIPLYGPSESSDTCGWLRQRAKTTGARKWRARYEACRRGN